MLEEKATEAALQLQVAALCAELTRAADVTGDGASPAHSFCLAISHFKLATPQLLKRPCISVI